MLYNSICLGSPVESPSQGVERWWAQGLEGLAVSVGTELSRWEAEKVPCTDLLKSRAQTAVPVA